MDRTVLPVAALLAAALLSTGCASVTLPSHDELEVFTDPPGALATCGPASAVTPGTLRIRRERTPAVVRVELEGYETREVVLDRTRDLPHSPWDVILGVTILSGLASSGCEAINYTECVDATLAAAIVTGVVGIAGFAIDSASDRARSLPRKELVLRLEPVRPAEAQEGEPR